MFDLRFQQLQQWVQQVLQQPIRIEKILGDASLRRYFRVNTDTEVWIVMDTGQEKDHSKSFVDIARKLEKKMVYVPHIKAMDLEQGFMLLEDFGDIQMLDVLCKDGKPNLAMAEKHYGNALHALLYIQIHVSGSQLPVYDRALLSCEMDLFTDWFLGTHLSIETNYSDKNILQLSFNTLITNALEQPKVFVHRDYHSRNLMILESVQNYKNSPGIIDFQDAVYGPITYDLVSLLRDCYISWPRSQVHTWVANYHKEAVLNRLCSCDLLTFQRWFDFMGMQRHLKAIGIFARLNYRDSKSSYLNDIPRTLAYIESVCAEYEVLKSFSNLLGKLQVRNKLEQLQLITQLL